MRLLWPGKAWKGRWLLAACREGFPSRACVGVPWRSRSKAASGHHTPGPAAGVPCAAPRRRIAVCTSEVTRGHRRVGRPRRERAHANKGRRLFSGTISKAQILPGTTLAARVLRSRRSAPASVVPQPLNGLSGTSVACGSHTSARPADSPACVGPSARAVFRLLPLHNHGGCAVECKNRGRFTSSWHWLHGFMGQPFRRTLPVPRQQSPIHVRLPPQWTGGAFHSTGPRRHSRRVHPVASFVCALVPGTTRWHAPVAPTALPERHPPIDPWADALGSRLRLVLLEALSSECSV